MISDKEFLEIVQGLYEKTASKSLIWQHSKAAASINAQGQHLAPIPGFQDAYWVQLPQSAIELQYGSPNSEPDFITFALLRGFGQAALAKRKVYEGDVGWDLLYDLFALIKRRELGWDDLYKNVREFLGKSNSAVIPQKGS